jgi:hypothetical protein
MVRRIMHAYGSLTASPALVRGLRCSRHDAQLHAVTLPGRVVDALLDLLVDILRRFDKGL